MPKLLVHLLLFGLLCSCKKDVAQDPTRTGPLSVVRYKVDGHPVEIKGTLVNDTIGSRLYFKVTQAGRSGPSFDNILQVKDGLNEFYYSTYSYYAGKDSLVTLPPNFANGSFKAAQWNLSGRLGGPNTTGFTFIVDAYTYTTISGRFYGSSYDTVARRLILITEGEFKDVWVTDKW
jgi:hypothetical protein